MVLAVRLTSKCRRGAPDPSRSVPVRSLVSRTAGEDVAVEGEAISRKFAESLDAGGTETRAHPLQTVAQNC